MPSLSDPDPRTFADHPLYLIARDAHASLAPNSTQRTTLIVAGVYIVVIAILWHVPYISFVIYPFKLLTVGFHEVRPNIPTLLLPTNTQLKDEPRIHG
ncbi:hypothetical protein EIP91_005763, partial [Steccherinum ochraceum]